MHEGNQLDFGMQIIAHQALGVAASPIVSRFPALEQGYQQAID